jgi:phage-related minor tail protein
MADKLTEIEKTIADLGYGTEEYHEAMGYYLMILARSQWRQADLARKRSKQRGKIIAQRDRKL